MAKFKVVTHKLTGASFGVSGEGYKLEMEALAPIDAEIIEIPAAAEEDFIRAARGADAIIAKDVRISKHIIDSLEQCKVIALGSVETDSVDVAAATTRNIPVTNVPDTFIEEVADHAMMLLLTTFRRLTTMDRFVREKRWREKRPLLSQFPHLIKQTLGFISFSHVARTTAVRTKTFDVHMLAYDPYIEKLVITQY